MPVIHGSDCSKNHAMLLVHAQLPTLHLHPKSPNLQVLPLRIGQVALCIWPKEASWLERTRRCKGSAWAVAEISSCFAVWGALQKPSKPLLHSLPHLVQLAHQSVHVGQACNLSSAAAEKGRRAGCISMLPTQSCKDRWTITRVQSHLFDFSVRLQVSPTS